MTHILAKLRVTNRTEAAITLRDAMGKERLLIVSAPSRDSIGEQPALERHRLPSGLICRVPKHSHRPFARNVGLPTACRSQCHLAPVSAEWNPRRAAEIANAKIVRSVFSCS
jgi:hypothetical protein